MKRTDVEHYLTDEEAQNLLEQYDRERSVRRCYRTWRYTGLHIRAIKRFLKRYGYNVSRRKYNVKMY